MICDKIKKQIGSFFTNRSYSHNHDSDIGIMLADNFQAKYSKYDRKGKLILRFRDPLKLNLLRLTKRSLIGT